MLVSVWFPIGSLSLAAVLGGLYLIWKHFSIDLTKDSSDFFFHAALAALGLFLSTLLAMLSRIAYRLLDYENSWETLVGASAGSAIALFLFLVSSLLAYHAGRQFPNARGDIAAAVGVFGDKLVSRFL